MTPLEGETAVIGLVVGNVMWPSILGALFLSRIWKVSTATRPKPVQQPGAETATEPVPAKALREAS